MESVDDETLAEAKRFIREQVEAGKPFFTWWNGTRMHFRTHVSEEKMARIREKYPHADEYTCGMIEHDMHVGELLDLLNELGVADNTVILYSTDNGPHFNTWPDAGATPFHGEKNSSWEGAFRVPAFIKWSGKMPAGVTLNGIVAHADWLPTFPAIARNENITGQLKNGVPLNGRTYKNYKDGINQLDYLTGQVEESPRKGFIYVTDGGNITALR